MSSPTYPASVKDGSVDYGERHIEQTGYRLGKQCLPRTRRPHHHDVALLYVDIHILIVAVGLGVVHFGYTLVMVVDRH